MSYLGATTGCVLAIPLLDLVPTKFALLSCLLIQIVSLALFSYADRMSQLAVARFLCGAMQVILAIFLPVWVDAFAPTEKKTRWMTLIITAAPMGLLAGYGMSAVVISITDSWWWAFYIVIAMMIPLMFIISCVDKTMIDIKEYLKLKQK